MKRNLACVLVDGRRRVEVEYNTPLWDASVEWAKFHGLDPMRIPGGSEVVRDEANHRILFEEFVFDGNEIVVDLDTMEYEVVQRVEQGEAGPLPFPR